MTVINISGSSNDTNLVLDSQNSTIDDSDIPASESWIWFL